VSENTPAQPWDGVSPWKGQTSVAVERLWEAQGEIANLEAKLRALESPQSKGRECWVRFNPSGTIDAYDRPVNGAVPMVEAPSKGDGEPSAARLLRGADAPLEPAPADSVYDLLCAVENKRMAFQAALYQAYEVGRNGATRAGVLSLRDGIGYVMNHAHADYCSHKDKHAYLCQRAAENLESFDKLFPWAAPKTERSEVPNPSSGEGSNPQSPSRNTQITPETP
jgi:hypothetical protein